MKVFKKKFSPPCFVYTGSLKGVYLITVILSVLSINMQTQNKGSMFHTHFTFFCRIYIFTDTGYFLPYFSSIYSSKNLSKLSLLATIDQNLA